MSLTGLHRIESRGERARSKSANSMFRRIEVKLSVPIVLPLVEFLRGREAALESAEQAQPAVGNEREWMGERGVRRLMLLFHSGFTKTGGILVSESEAPALVRACSFIRLELRRTVLSSVSDDLLESGLDANSLIGDEHRGMMCYLFLATLQQALLNNLPVLQRSGDHGGIAAKYLSSVIERGARIVSTQFARLRLRRLANSDGRTAPWQVMVLNDPVNLLGYVSAVLRRELQLSDAVANERMREVHHAKSSVVWQGPREEAEARARRLRGWHLTAVLRPL